MHILLSSLICLMFADKHWPSTHFPFCSELQITLKHLLEVQDILMTKCAESQLTLRVSKVCLFQFRARYIRLIPSIILQNTENPELRQPLIKTTPKLDHYFKDPFKHSAILSPLKLRSSHNENHFSPVMEVVLIALVFSVNLFILHLL